MKNSESIDEKSNGTTIVGFRVEKSLRDEFDRICKQKDVTSSQVMRRCMREFIRASQGQGQKTDFEGNLALL